MVKSLKFNEKSDADKFPESLWKFLTYTFLWSYTYYLLIYTKKYNYFTEPYDMWEGIFLFEEKP